MEIVQTKLKQNPTLLTVSASNRGKLSKNEKQKIFELLQQNSSVEQLEIKVPFFFIVVNFYFILISPIQIPLTESEFIQLLKLLSTHNSIKSLHIDFVNSLR